MVARYVHTRVAPDVDDTLGNLVQACDHWRESHVSSLHQPRRPGCRGANRNVQLLLIQIMGVICGLGNASQLAKIVEIAQVDGNGLLAALHAAPSIAITTLCH